MVQAEALIAMLVAIRDRGRQSDTTVATMEAPAPSRFAAEVGRHDLEPDDLEPGCAVEASDTPSAFLEPSRSLGQRFRASADGLCRVDVRVGTDGRPHRHRLAIQVSASPGDAAPLRRVSIDASTIADHAWVAASFDPIPDSAGRDFYLCIESDGAAPGDAVTLWTYVRGHGDTPPGGLHLDHRLAPGSLAFRTFYRSP
jgi:hypothetical protein